MLGKNGRSVGSSCSAGVFKKADPFASFCVVGEARAQVPLHFCFALVDRSGGEFFVQPVHNAANIIHSRSESERFTNVNASLFIKGEGHRIRQKRLCGPEVGFQTGRDAEAFDGEFGFVGRWCEKGFCINGAIALALSVACPNTDC